MKHTKPLFALLCASLIAATLASPYTPAIAAPTEGFASPQIRAIWQRDDAHVASHSVSRSWMWGPGPFYTDYEPYREAPEGNHLVQYFDKGRLEINDPNADPNSPWYVTSGLLVKEMVAGKAQVGNDAWYNIGPAHVPVAGDTAPGVPTYAHFASFTNRTTNRTGQPLVSNSYLRAIGDRAEVVGGLNPPAPVSLARFEEASAHNWANVFLDYVNSPAMPAGFNWLYSLGLPITEPYWVTASINGVPKPIIVQLFERRTLTYNPTNPPATQVEMGNVGRAYYTWRYAASHPADLSAQYNVTFSISPAPSRTTQLTEALTFTNNTGIPLDRVVLHIPWNHWKNVFTLTSITVGGKQADTAWRQDINLEIALPQPASPGAKISIELSAQLKPRPVGGRTGYDVANDILTLGDALPTLVPWQNGDWQYYPYSELGDLGNNPTSNYSVTISSTSGEKLVVGGTGRVTTRNNGDTSWHFEAPNVRDVAYVISPRFINPLDDPSMAHQEGSVHMFAYFLPGHKADGQRQLQLIAPALAWFSSRIGPYPFDTYTIAEMGVPLERTDNYAQEYPMAYFVPGSWLKLGTAPGTWEWYTPVHEVGHQWFYSTVGNNQLTDPWLDEAMTTYITAEYVRANFPDQYSRSYASMTASATTARPVSAGVYSGFASENQYSAAVYDTGVLMLDKVRRAMGDTDFYAALRDYYSTYKFQRARPTDLTTILQNHTKSDLHSIFSTYLANGD
jgi:hypothetical protein